MKTQYYSTDYLDNIEAKKVIEAIEKEFTEEKGMLFYKFPVIKEFDKPPIAPDIFFVCESIGAISIIIDTVNVDRNGSVEILKGKTEQIDNYIYTSLLKNKNLKVNARTLKFEVVTLAYCPNLQIADDNVFSSLRDLLNKILEFKKDATIDETEIQEIISSLEASTAIIKPKERILEETDNNTKASVLKEIESKIARFDDEQRESAWSLIDGPQRIRGLAGSGKTIILCLKAARLHMEKPDAKILYTFYTKSLYDYIVHLITRFYLKLTDGQTPNFEKINVLHAWGGRQVRGVYFEACINNGVQPIKYEDVRTKKNAFAYICEQFIHSTKNNANKEYDYILIDEAQDFEAPFYQLCRSIVKNDRLVWCYDEVQNIFDVNIQNTKTTFSNEYDNQGIDLAKLQLRHPNLPNDIVLHKSYRNLKEILLIAVALGFGIYNDKLIQSLDNNEHWRDLGFNVIEGDCSKEEFVVIERSSDASPLLVDENKVTDFIKGCTSTELSDELDWISSEVEKAITEDKLLPEDITIICLDTRNIKKYFDGLEKRLSNKKIGTFNVVDRAYVKGFSRENKVTLSSVFKAKGNESAMVFVCGCDVFEKQKDNRQMRNMIFTSFTRAKVWLRYSGCGDNQLTQLRKEIKQLKDNNLQFRFMNKPTHLLDKDWREKDLQHAKEDAAIKAIYEESKRLGMTPEQFLAFCKDKTYNKEEKSDE